MDISNGSILQELTRLKEQLERDTSISGISEDDNKLILDIKMDIERNKNIDDDFNEFPVFFCRHCKSLYIEVDESNNDICHRCGAINEISSLPSIEEYLDRYGKIWDDEEY